MTNSVRTSRDGDQFHYLWAARRCLALLPPNTDLVGISIEGSSLNEFSPEADTLEGEEQIDIAEYYGDEDVSHAQLVRYMQLKHSTRQAAKTWTASGLKKTLQSFSARYKDLLGQFSADNLEERLEFWFVTNRHVSAKFKEAVDDAASDKVPRHRNEHQKLEKITGFTGVALSSFCLLVHFEDSQDDYWDQRNILFQDVSGYLPDLDVDAPIQLKELVTRKALSESENNPIIKKMDVLRALGTDESRLYPASCLIETIDNAIPREQEPDVIQSIIRAEDQPVIIHALAGVGKSVFSTRIQTGLPKGSVSVLYDCFGNGQYRNASGYRHHHQEALVQIANELAAKRLCHPLIPTVHTDASSYVRAFNYRIQQTIRIIQLENPNAVLCILIDAADNAQMAAEEIGESHSFVRDLLREPLPDGVRLVVLCRSHRQNNLDPPLKTLRFELKPFSETETAAYLRQTYPDASDSDVAEFHRLSSQNPRVQALALSRNLPLAETLRLLGPNPTTVESTIGSLLNDAIANLRDSVGHIESEQIDRFCAGLAALRPLIPIPVLSQISGVPKEAIGSFALDIGRPLHLSGDTIQFFDEPAETWFREQFKPSQDEMAGFISNLKTLAFHSAYVASTLPQLMLEAGQFSELVELALASSALPETNPVEKHDVELQRLQFALKASLRDKRYLDAAKLALKAGGVTVGDDRQRKIIQANTDLAALFIETGHIQEIVSRRTFGSGWIGSHHVYEAGLLSGCNEHIYDARSRLRMAHEWLNNWRCLPPEERKKEQISVSDIAELIMAQLNIHGVRVAANSISMWNPREFSYRVGCIIACRLIDHGRLVELNDLAEAAGNDLNLMLAINVELRAIQKTVSAEVVKRAFQIVSHSDVGLKELEALDSEEPGLDEVTALVEAALKLSLCSHIEAATILTRYLPVKPPLAFAQDYTWRSSPLLRAYCLRASLEGKTLELTDLAHPELKAELEKETHYDISREAQEFKEVIGALLPWYQLWAKTLLGKITIEALPDQLAQTRDVSEAVARFQYREVSHASNEIVLIWLDILNNLDTVNTETVGVLISWTNSLWRPLFTPTMTAMARQCAWKEETKAIALNFAGKAFRIIQDERMDAESKSDSYIEIARSILAISAPEAKAYFNEAVEVASKIGEENIFRWQALLYLADRASCQERPAPGVAYKFAQCAELTWEYALRDEHFDWHSTVRSFSCLCPRSTLGILSRWCDRRFGNSGSILSIAVHSLVEQDCVDPRDMLALVSFKGSWEYPKLLGSVLDKCTDHCEKEASCVLILRYMKWEYQSSSVWRDLKKVATKHGLSFSDIDTYIKFSEDEERVISERQGERWDEPFANELQKHNWEEVFSGNHLTTVAGISQSYEAFKKSSVLRYQEKFFAETIRRIPVDCQINFIEAVGNTPVIGLYQLRDFFEQIPADWAERLAIKQSLEVTLKAFCRRLCMDITRNRTDEVLPFELVCKLTGVCEADIVKNVLDAVGESPDLLDSTHLFSLVGLLKSMLNHNEALEALTYGLSFYDPILENSDGDGPWSDKVAPPDSVQESIAGYIYSGLAAPPAARRWEAAHAVLGLCARARKDVIQHLVKLDEVNSGGPFADAHLYFYQLHARQWLMIAFARAATEFPDALAPFTSRFVDLALNDRPHVMIRQFAARTAIALLDNRTLLPDEDVVNSLLRVNVTPYPVVESTRYDRINHHVKDNANVDDEDRFYFGIDIGPYWYKPLGEVFALSQDEIEKEALNVIRSDLNFSAQRAMIEDERERRKYYNYQQTDGSHGTYPCVDNLQYYIAYHAMMIVAGRLLATTPTHRDIVWDKQDEFAEWLARHDLSRNDGRWLADRRDPKPLERLEWCKKDKGDTENSVVTPEDFDQALRTRDNLNVWGSWSTTDSTRVQTVRLRSALVSPDRSLALLKAMCTVEDEYVYVIPESDSEYQINRAGFVLEGWIEDRGREAELDGMDHWSGGVQYPPPVPAAEIVELMTLVTDSDNRVWCNGMGAPVMSSQVWGHKEELNQENNPERGERLYASFDLVNDLLGKLNRDLIVKVQIERSRRYSRYERRQDHDEQDSKATKLYLIKTDGSITTL